MKFNKIQKSPNIKLRKGLLVFNFNGTYITDPTMDEVGGYRVNAEEYYSLSKKDIKKMLKKNLPELYKEYPEWKSIRKRKK